MAYPTSSPEGKRRSAGAIALADLRSNLSHAQAGLSSFDILEQMDRMAQEHDPLAPHLGEIMDVITLMRDGVCHRLAHAERLVDEAMKVAEA